MKTQQGFSDIGWNLESLDEGKAGPAGGFLPCEKLTDPLTQITLVV